MSLASTPASDTAVPATPFLASLKTQIRIIGALLMREIITRYGRHNIGFMWLFIEPMMFTSGILVVWTALGLHKSVTLPVVPFTFVGYATVLMWRNTVNRCGNAIEPNRALMHHRNVRAIDLFAARIILEMAGATMSFIILGVALGLVGLVPVPHNLLKILFGWLLLAWFSTGMALIVGSLCVLSESVERVWHVISYLYLPICGAFVMVSWMPQRFQAILLWVPSANCAELIREGLFGPWIYAQYDIPYVMIFNLLATLAGLLMVRYVARRVEGE